MENLNKVSLRRYLNYSYWDKVQQFFGVRGIIYKYFGRKERMIIIFLKALRKSKLHLV